MSKNKVRLHAPPGTDEANSSFSPVPYRADNDGIVEVDEEAVGPLLEKGGFTLVDPPGIVEVPHGFVQVVHPTDAGASCSFGGESYVPDADGVLTVPCEAVGDLLAHGFISFEAFTSVSEHPSAQVAISSDAPAATPLATSPETTAQADKEADKPAN